MSDESGLWLSTFVGLGLLGGIFIGFLIGMTHGSNLTYRDVMKEAYDRGHAVQCLGKEGYYWVCKE